MQRLGSSNLWIMLLVCFVFNEGLVIAAVCPGGRLRSELSMTGGDDTNWNFYHFESGVLTDPSGGKRLVSANNGGDFHIGAIWHKPTFPLHDFYIEATVEIRGTADGKGVGFFFADPASIAVSPGMYPATKAYGVDWERFVGWAVIASPLEHAVYAPWVSTATKDNLPISSSTHNEFSDTSWTNLRNKAIYQIRVTEVRPTTPTSNPQLSLTVTVCILNICTPIAPDTMLQEPPLIGSLTFGIGAFNDAVKDTVDVYDVSVWDCPPMPATTSASVTATTIKQTPTAVAMTDTGKNCLGRTLMSDRSMAGGKLDLTDWNLYQSSPTPDPAGAKRLVLASVPVPNQVGVMSHKRQLSLNNFYIEATVEISEADGDGVAFIFANPQSIATPTTKAYGVDWSQFNGLAVIASPMEHAIYAPWVASRTTDVLTTSDSTHNSFSDDGRNNLRSKATYQIRVIQVKPTAVGIGAPPLVNLLTVTVCISGICTQTATNVTLNEPPPLLGTVFGIGAFSNTVRNTVDVFDVTFFDCTVVTTTSTSTTTPKPTVAATATRNDCPASSTRLVTDLSMSAGSSGNWNSYQFQTGLPTDPPGAKRLVSLSAPADMQIASIWNKKGLGLNNFYIEATVEISGNDGNGLAFVFANQQSIAQSPSVSPATKLYGVQWNQFTGLAIIASPSEHAIYAPYLQSATPDVITTPESTHNAFSDKGRNYLRSRATYQIRVKEVREQTGGFGGSIQLLLTVTLCISNTCTQSATNLTLIQPSSPIGSLTFGIGAFNDDVKDTVDVYDVSVWDCTPIATTAMSTTTTPKPKPIVDVADTAKTCPGFRRMNDLSMAGGSLDLADWNFYQNGAAPDPAGAKRLVAANAPVPTHVGAMWHKQALSLTNFYIEATVEISAADGNGVAFIFASPLSIATAPGTSPATKAYGVDWSQFLGLAIIASPMEHAIYAPWVAMRTMDVLTTSDSTHNSFSDEGRNNLRSKATYQIRVIQVKPTAVGNGAPPPQNLLTVTVCISAICTQTATNVSLNEPPPLPGMVFGIGAFSNNLRNTVDVFDVSFYDCTLTSTTTTSTTVSAPRAMNMFDVKSTCPVQTLRRDLSMVNGVLDTANSWNIYQTQNPSPVVSGAKRLVSATSSATVFLGSIWHKRAIGLNNFYIEANVEISAADGSGVAFIFTSDPNSIATLPAALTSPANRYGVQWGKFVGLAVIASPAEHAVYASWVQAVASGFSPSPSDLRYNKFSDTARNNLRTKAIYQIRISEVATTGIGSQHQVLLTVGMCISGTCTRVTPNVTLLDPPQISGLTFGIGAYYNSPVKNTVDIYSVSVYDCNPTTTTKTITTKTTPKPPATTTKAPIPVTPKETTQRPPESSVGSADSQATSAQMASVANSPSQQAQQLIADKLGERDVSNITGAELLVACGDMGATRPTPPTSTTSGPVIIKPQFSVDRLADISTVAESITVAGTILLSWNLSTCLDNTTSGDKMQQIYITSPNEVWTPGFRLASSAGSVQYLQENGDFGQDLIATLWKNGTKRIGMSFYWLKEGTFSSTCKLDLAKFPFDKQTCVFSFALIRQESVVQFKDPEFLWSQPTTGLSDSSEWRFQGSETFMNALLYNARKTSAVYFSVTVKRNPGYYLTNLILPSAVLVLVEVGTFVLPPGFTDRAAFSVTLLLTVAMTQSTVMQQIPKTSQRVLLIDYITILSWFCAACTIYQMTMCWFVSFREERKEANGNAYADKAPSCLARIGPVRILDFLVTILVIGTYVGIHVYFLKQAEWQL